MGLEPRSGQGSPDPTSPRREASLFDLRPDQRSGLSFWAFFPLRPYAAGSMVSPWANCGPLVVCACDGYPRTRILIRDAGERDTAMTKRILRDNSEMPIRPGFYPSDYDEAVRPYVRELRCAYLLSYVCDSSQAGDDRWRLRVATCAGILADIQSASYSDLAGIDKLREDIGKELLANLVSVATAKPIDEYKAMFLPVDGVYIPELRNLLTVGRSVEMASSLSASKKPPRTPNELFGLFSGSLLAAPGLGGNRAPYSRDPGDIRIAWKKIEPAAHVAAAYHTLRGHTLLEDIRPHRPFRGIRVLHDELFDHAEAYQELLCGRKVISDSGEELECSRLYKVPIWRIPKKDSGDIARLPVAAIAAFPAETKGTRPRSGIGTSRSSGSVADKR